MNKLTIIGNLTRDPELRTTQDKISVCTFSVAVNRKKTNEVDYFRVTAWRQLGENCAKFLSKGKKVCVVGAVSLHTWESGASMEVTADDVEFLSPKGDQGGIDPKSGLEKVQPDDLPY